MRKKDIKIIKIAGVLHDIGKIGVSEELINKSGKLSSEEYIEICRHSQIGYNIINTFPNMSEIAEIILSHHERWDGNGYPFGLRGEEIPLYSRIIAIADTYDAITSERSYKEAISSEKAVEELKNNAGTQFDPELITLFVDEIVKLLH